MRASGRTDEHLPGPGGDVGDRGADDLLGSGDGAGASLRLGGRERQLDDPVERARKTVWRRIRTTLDRIDAQHPMLAHHLRRSLRTGTFCSYTTEVAVDWVVT